MSSMLTQIAPVLYGCGAVNELGDKIKEQGGSKVLLVSDEGLKAVGTVDRVAKIIADAGLEVVVVDNIITEPPDYQIDEVYHANKDKGIDLIVGLGGGSCMDAAKAIAFMFSMGYDSIQPYLMPGPFEVKIPLILVPTTSGTGSESSLVGVIANTAEDFKGGVLYPMALSIVDPELAVTMDPFLTAITGMDAFSHAAEAMTSNMHNPKSDALGSAALRDIVEALPVAVANGSDIEARSKMAAAANLAAMAFSDSFVHFGHAMAESIGAKCEGSEGHISHGLCCALVTPAIMEYVGDLCDDRIVSVAKALGVEICEGDDCPAIGAKVGDCIRALIREVGIPSFEQIGVTREALAAIAGEVASNFHNEAAIAPITPEIAEKYILRAYDAYR